MKIVYDCSRPAARLETCNRPVAGLHSITRLQGVCSTPTDWTFIHKCNILIQSASVLQTSYRRVIELGTPAWEKSFAEMKTLLTLSTLKILSVCMFISLPLFLEFHELHWRSRIFFRVFVHDFTSINMSMRGFSYLILIWSLRIFFLEEIDLWRKWPRVKSS